MELTAAMIKLAHSLSLAKRRREEGLFKVEGTKGVMDTLGAFSLRWLAASGEWLAEHELDPGARARAVVAKARDLERMSSLSTAPEVIAIYELPEQEAFDPVWAERELMLALDTIQDPGNLGTIVRMADWFGIKHVICSRETADIFSPKCVQSTMGAISRVRVTYCDLPEALSRVKAPVYGTFLDGDDLYKSSITPNGVIVIGNEGRGISAAVEREVSHRLFIPPYPGNTPTSESLNAAMAASIAVAEFRRQARLK